MNDTSMHMGPYMHNAFWLKDRITITFQLEDTIPTYNISPQNLEANASNNADMTPEENTFRISPPTFRKKDAIAALAKQIDQFNSYLQTNSYPSLKPIDFTDTLRIPGSKPPENSDEVGKYLFTTKDQRGRYVPTMICFFKFDPAELKAAMPSIAPMPNSDSPPMAPMPGMGSSSQTPSMPGSGSMDNGNTNSQSMNANDSVSQFVNFINGRIAVIRDEHRVALIAASPTYYTGAAPNTWPVGCPVAPPMPVPADMHCANSSDLWPITLSGLPTELERATGDGVNVLILDTLPSQNDINRAAEGAEEHNLLLLDVVNNVVMQHNHLPHQIDDPNPVQPKAGKDVTGRIVGFRLADHGLAIAGIVRSIAPNAHVECIRALNDFCAGDGTAFIKVLETIHNRMLLINPDDNGNQGDLYQKPVIINLSLVVPPDSMLSQLGLQNISNVRTDLLRAMQSLADLGVIFVSSAGNEGDSRYQPANPSGVRPNALYPAAFAYNGLMPGTSIIPVGAVNKHGDAASYSCYPGDLGIATYGGDVPQQFKKDSSGCFTEAEHIDGVIGLYTGLSFPSLLLEDCEPTYPAPNSHAWAYWSGTSFATPIVSGLMARFIENELSNAGTFTLPNVSIPQALANVNATKQITWDRLDPDFRIETGAMISAVQCVPAQKKKEREEAAQNVFNLTVNESRS